MVFFKVKTVSGVSNTSEICRIMSTYMMGTLKETKEVKLPVKSKVVFIRQKTPTKSKIPEHNRKDVIVFIPSWSFCEILEYDSFDSPCYTEAIEREEINGYNMNKTLVDTNPFIIECKNLDGKQCPFLTVTGQNPVEMLSYKDKMEMRLAEGTSYKIDIGEPYVIIVSYNTWICFTIDKYTSIFDYLQ